MILRQEECTESAIGERLAVSKTAVHQAVVKFKNCGSYSNCKRSGRPRKTTRRDDILIKRCVVKSPTCSAKKIRAELGETGSRISRRTISPSLHPIPRRLPNTDHAIQKTQPKCFEYKRHYRRHVAWPNVILRFTETHLKTLALSPRNLIS